MLKSIYPEHKWIPWKFNRFPINAHLDEDVVAKALSFVEKERDIQSPEDWYGISENVLKEMGLLPLFSRLGGLYAVLKQHRPEVRWKEAFAK